MKCLCVTAGWELGSAARKLPEQLQHAAYRMGSTAPRHSDGSVHHEFSYPLFGLSLEYEDKATKNAHSHSIQAPHSSAEPQLLYQQAEPTARSSSHSRVPQDAMRPQEHLQPPPPPARLARGSSAGSARAAMEPGGRARTQRLQAGLPHPGLGRPFSLQRTEPTGLADSRSPQHRSNPPQNLTGLLNTAMRKTATHHIPHHPPLWRDPPSSRPFIAAQHAPPAPVA